MSRYKAYAEYKDSGLGWLGEMPVHWELVKAKYLFNRVQREVRVEDGVVTAFRDGQVTLRTKRRTEGFTESIKEIGYQGVRVGDLLVHAMDGFAGAIGVSDSDGKCSPVCSVCVPVEPSRTFVRYYGYLVRQLAVTDFISSLAKGIRERSTEFRYSEFSGLELAFPSVLEQRTIANFLDHETTKIDALIAKQQGLIKLLKEKRQAVISHAVTKGLNPNAPMRDSGVEWLGEVPAHWEVSRIKQVAKVESGHTPDKKIEAYWVDCNIPWVSLNDSTQLKGIDYISETAFYLNEKGIANSSARKLPARCVVFTRDASIGLAAITTKIMAVSQHLIAWICDPQKVIPEYLLLVFYAMADELERFTFGATIKTIGMADVNKLVAAFPSVSEQKTIVEYVFQFKKNVDISIIKVEEAIRLSKERRIALISAAVTGKIDMRGWQEPRQPAPELKDAAA